MSTFLQSKTAGAKPRRKMDGGLLCVSETELTSVRLIERAHARALADKLTLAEMMRIWRCIGRVIGASLMLGKGVNVDGLGVFCFDLDGAPMFALQPVGGRARNVAVAGEEELNQDHGPHLNLRR